MKKLVSIVVPVYNAEKYITNCVQALQRQLYQNIEIILVDDGSIDESLRICNSLAEKDSRIRVVHKDNGGVGSARNCGIREAQGEYLVFCDSDDIADPYWVWRMVQLAEQWNVNFVICSYRMVKKCEEAKVPIQHQKPFEPVWAQTREEFFNVLAYMMAFRETMFQPWNKLFYTSIIKEHQIRFPEDMDYGEDFLFNIQYLEYCNGVVETREKLYNYIVQNPESLEKRYRPDLFENQTRLYKAAKDFLINHDAYSGFNVSNLSYYYVCRVVAAVKNQFHEKNNKCDLEIRKYVDKIVKDKEVIEAVFIADLHDNEEQSLFTDLIKGKQYDKVYDALKDIVVYRQQNESTVRYKVLPEQPWGWRWMPYTFKSIKQYGVVITFRRITGKIRRKLGR